MRERDECHAVDGESMEREEKLIKLIVELTVLCLGY
jgi:hypothetical protein